MKESPMSEEEALDWFQEIKELKDREPTRILVLQIMTIVLQYMLEHGKVLNRRFLREAINNVKAGKPIFKKI